MTNVEMWALLGVGRISALAREFECDYQFMKLSSHKLDKNELQRAICRVEQREMKKKRSIENNILNSSLHVCSEHKTLKDMAIKELKCWSEIYSNFCE